MRQSYLEKLLAEKIQVHFIKYKLEIDGIGNFSHTDSWALLEYVKFFFSFFNKQYKIPVIILKRVSIIIITLFLFSATFLSLSLSLFLFFLSL